VTELANAPSGAAAGPAYGGFGVSVVQVIARRDRTIGVPFPQSIPPKNAAAASPGLAIDEALARLPACHR
jgi:hypothetical protein